jgi:hypothetical protein
MNGSVISNTTTDKNTPKIAIPIRIPVLSFIACVIQKEVASNKKIVDKIKIRFKAINAYKTIFLGNGCGFEMVLFVKVERKKDRA